MGTRDAPDIRLARYPAFFITGIRQDTEFARRVAGWILDIENSLSN
jgi:hypothetical protein